MVHIRKTLFILTTVIIVSACGFHLRGINGNNRFPFQKIYVQCDNVIICSNLTNAVKIQDLATLLPSPESADVTIQLFNEQTKRDPQGFNGAGRISSYLLTYQVQARILQKNKQIGNDIKVAVSASMNYSDSILLAVNQNEAVFWTNLHENATNQLIRQLIYFKPYKSVNTNASNIK